MTRKPIPHGAGAGAWSGQGRRRKPLKPGMKIPVCTKCGRELNGSVPDDATEIICYLCDNPPTKPRTARDRK